MIKTNNVGNRNFDTDLKVLIIESFIMNLHLDIIDRNPSTEEEKQKLVNEIQRRCDFCMKINQLDQAEILYRELIKYKPDQKPMYEEICKRIGKKPKKT